MRYDKHLFRCSALGHLMTEPKSKEAKARGDLSEGTITHLIDIFISERYARNTDISNKYITKGLMVEEDSITLYSRNKKTMFLKNQEHLKNAYIMGTPDMYRGASIREATEIIDVKSSWDIYTFFRNRFKAMNSLYYWQLQGYMALSGAKKATLAYCLVDTPDSMIYDEQRRLFYKMGVIDETDKAFKLACEELEMSMKFGDIPMNERIIEYAIERNDDDIQRLYAKIEKARAQLNKMHSDLDSLERTYDHEVKATIIS